MNSKKYYLPVAVMAFSILFMPLAVGRSSSAQDIIESSLIVEPESSTELMSAPPTTPPDASKITVNPPNTDGYSVVIGAAGTVPGNVGVAIINLNTRNVITATADNNGGFQATIFAPPGSTLLVKYSPNTDLIDLLWDHALNPGGDFSYMNPLPGTTIFVPGSNPERAGFVNKLLSYNHVSAEDGSCSWRPIDHHRQ